MPQMPSHFGRFEILERVGAGAFGVVFKARDPVLDRVVALKLPSLQTFASEELVERFVREAKIAARLDHPNIVRLLETDRIGEIWYLVSDYVDGPNLEQWIKRQDSPPSPAFAARLTLQLAGAIAYAHDQRIIHRDLKPANVLMEKSDADQDWRPRLTDFGLAKFIEPSASMADLTKTGQWVGTPSYMSPEQIDGKSELMTVCSDVYGLGAVLYDLLTGKPPFTGLSAHEVMTQIKEDDPARPRSQRRQIPADLETICLKCLEKDPNKRYASAALLREDLDRFLTGRPVLARPVSALGRMSRWSKRNPAWAALVATVTFSLVAIAVGATLYAAEQARLNRELERVADNERQARQHSDELVYAADMRIASDEVANGQIASAMDHLSRHIPKEGELDRRGIEWHCAWNQIHDWDRKLIGHEGAVYGIAFSPDGGTLASVGADERVRFWNTSTWTLDEAKPGHEAEINDLAFSSDGQRLITGDDLGVIGVWDVASRRLLRTIATGLPRIASLCWCPHINRVAAVGGTSKLALMDPETGELDSHELPSSSLRAVAADDQPSMLLALGDQAGDISLFHLRDRALWKKWHAHDGYIHALGFPAGLYSVGIDYTIKAWNISTQELLQAMNLPQEAYSIAVASNRAHLLAASKDRTIYRIDHIAEPSSPKYPYPVARGHRDRVWSLAIHPSGTCFASADRSGEIQIRKLVVGTRPNEFHLPGVAVRRAIFSPNGHYLAATDQRMDGKNVVHVFNTASGSEVMQIPAANLPEQVVLADAGSLCFSNDSSRLAVNGGGGIRLVDLESKQVRQLGDDRSPSMGWVQSFSSDARSLFLNGSDTVYQHSIDLNEAVPIARDLLLASWNRSSEDWILRRGPRYRVVAEPINHSSKPIELLGMTEMVVCADVSPDGRYVVAGGLDRTVRVWDLPSTQLLFTFVGHTGRLHHLKFTPDSSRVLSFSGEDNTLRCWELETRQEVMRLGGESEKISCFDLAPDGSQIVVGYTGAGQSRIKFFPLTENPPRKAPVIRFDRPTSSPETAGHAAKSPVAIQMDYPLGPPSGFVRCAALSPTGKLVAVGDADGTILIRETSTWKTVLEAQINSLGVAGLDFSADEKKLAVAHEDGVIAIIHLEQSPSFTFVATVGLSLSCIKLGPDSRRLALGLKNNAVHVFDLRERRMLPGVSLPGEITKIEFLVGTPNLLVSTRDGTVAVWNWEKNEILAQFNTHRQVTDFAVLRDQETVLIPARSYFVKWHYPTGTIQRTVTSTKGGYRTIDLLPGQQTAMCLALGGAKLKMIDVTTLEETTYPSGLSSAVHDLHWSSRTGAAICTCRSAPYSARAVVGVRIQHDGAETTVNSKDSVMKFNPTIDDRLRKHAAIWSHDKRATSIAGDGSRSLSSVEALLRSINGYARRSGFAAAIPIAWHEDWTPNKPFEICLLRQGVGEYRELTVPEIWGPQAESIISLDGHRGGIQERFRAAELYATRVGWKSAIPLFSEKLNADGKVVYPTLLLPNHIEIRDVDVADLGSSMTTLTTMAAVHAYAVKHGFGTGVPMFRRGVPDNILRLGVVMLLKEAVESRMVSLDELLVDDTRERAKD